MVNNVFGIPGQVGEGPLQDVMRVADAVQYTPETQPGAFQFFKERENRIFSYRDAAVALNQERNKGVLSAFGWLRPSMQLADLIKLESEIGGELYGKGFGKEQGWRFWLDHKGTSPYVTQNNIGDWYFTQPVQLADGKMSEVILHYATQPTEVVKLHNGKPYPLSIAELETFCQLVERYEEAVRRELYPIDDSIHDLENEIEEEHLVAAGTQDKMFSHAAVERMIEEYKAKQALENDSKNDYDLAA